MPSGKKKQEAQILEEESRKDEDFDSEESEGEEEEIPPFEDADNEDDDEDEQEDIKDIKELDIIPLEIGKKRKRIREEKEEETNDSSVVYLGRIPYGFFEEQMRGFFSQFGFVKKIRLSRNKKTGKSKHYAFMEFESPEVAKIVAESMNNYLLYGHKIVCKVVPKAKVHPDTFKGANRKFKKIPYRKIAKEQHNKPKEPEQAERTIKRLVKNENKKREKLKELGIEYDFAGYAANVIPAPLHKKFET